MRRTRIVLVRAVVTTAAVLLSASAAAAANGFTVAAPFAAK